MARILLYPLRHTPNFFLLIRGAVPSLRFLGDCGVGSVKAKKEKLKRGIHMQQSKEGPTMQGHGRGIRKGLMKRAGASIAVLCLLTMSVMIAGCGGGGGEGVSSQTVSGVAATGAPLVGEAKIKDSSTPTQEKTTVIGSDGSFAFDVSDMTGPFILRATGQADGETHTLLVLCRQSRHGQHQPPDKRGCGQCRGGG